MIAISLSILLAYAVLTMWIEARWAWAAAQSSAFLLAGAWAVGYLYRPSPLRGSLWIAPLAAAPLWGLAQIATGRTIYRWATWESILDWSTWFVLFFLALQLFHDPSARHRFLRYAAWFGFILAVVSTIQMFTSAGKIFWLFPSGYTENVLGPFVNRNQYAAFLELILPVALWQAVRGGRPVAGYIMAAAMLASVIAGASRAGTTLMCAEIVAVTFAAWQRGVFKGRQVARVIAVFAAMAILFTAAVGFQTLRQRFWKADPLGGRREFAISSLHMVRDKPALGFGLGNWPRVYPAYALFDDGTYVNAAHNDWLQWAVEGGVPFLAFQLCLAAMACKPAWRSVWGIGLISVWLHCLADYPFQQRPAVGAWFFVLLGTLAASRWPSHLRGMANVPKSYSTAEGPPQSTACASAT